MKKLLFFVALITLSISFSAKAQIENVIVEKYYVSDSKDSTDATGGKLEDGSVTYRIFVDLKAGSRLLKIYGDANHVLKFESTADFFNNIADGQTFAKDFSKNRYEENTVALDSWLTIGQTSRVSSKTTFGILKTQDRDGSFVGGINNDGGSAAIQGGLLTNYDASAGIPLTSADGHDTMAIVPSSWADYGFTDLITAEDSTIFGSLKTGNSFISNNAGLLNSGTTGIIADSNQVLIAQLTTKGEISFELNLEVEEPDGSSTKIIKYVANANTLLADEKLSPYLKYPPSCGCKNTDYLEYSAAYACENNDSCKTKIVFGCMDKNACNYNEDANFDLPALCCYPGFCNDRNIEVVCPDGDGEKNKDVIANLYPNPATENLKIEFKTGKEEKAKLEIINALGAVVFTKDIFLPEEGFTDTISLNNMQKGVYSLQLVCSGKTYYKTFIKF